MIVAESPTVVRVVPGDPHHGSLLGHLAAEPLATQWWCDAESRVRDEPDRSYMVVYVGGVAAAWAGWIVQGSTLLCCHNYVRRSYRGRTPELYGLAYRARQHHVVDRLGLDAVTYLFPEPIGMHVADGWVPDVGPDASGTSVPYPGGPVHRWQRLTWKPVNQR